MNDVIFTILIFYFCIGVFASVSTWKLVDAFLWPFLLLMLMWWRIKEIISGDI